MEESKKKELSVGQWLLIICIFWIALIPFVKLSVETQGTVITEDGIKLIKSSDFTLIEEETTGTRNNDGTYTVKGKLKQNIEESYTGLMLTLDLLDVNQKKVRETTGWIYTNYIGNNIWEFEVTGNDADGVVVDYVISSCYGY